MTFWSAAGLTLVACILIAAASAPSRPAYAGVLVVPTDTPRPPAPTDTPAPPAPTDTPAPPTPAPPAPPAPGVRAPDALIVLDGNGLCSPQNGLVQYTVRVGNSGDSPAYNVLITNILGDGAQIESVNLGWGVVRKGEAANISVFDVGTVDPGKEIIATVTLRLTGAPGSPVNVVARTETSTPGDPTLNNIQALSCALAVATPEPAATAPIILPVTGGDF